MRPDWVRSDPTVRGMGIFNRREADETEKPRYGYGREQRPLWTVRDRDAEEIRKVLRRAKRKEFGTRDGGFVVEGGSDRAPFLVAAALDNAAAGTEEIKVYAEVLAAAGYRVEPEPEDRQTLRVWPAGT